MEKQLVFSFEKGGDPDPFRVTMEFAVACRVDAERKQLIVEIEERSAESIKKLIEGLGYQFVQEGKVETEI